MAAILQSTAFRRGAPALLALALVSLMVLRTSAAAFSDTTDNADNYFETGFIQLDDDAVGALFEVEAMRPGTEAVRCINIEYTGNIEDGLGEVRLYSGGTEDDTDELAADLDLVIEEGTGSVDVDCTDFAADGAPRFDGTFDAFLAFDDYDSGVGDWTPDTPSDPTPDERSYRITVTAGASAQMNAQLTDVTFVWEVQTTE